MVKCKKCGNELSNIEEIDSDDFDIKNKNSKMNSKLCKNCLKKEKEMKKYERNIKSIQKSVEAMEKLNPQNDPFKSMLGQAKDISNISNKAFDEVYKK